MGRLVTHSGRIDRWLGGELAESISNQFRLWQGPPVKILGTPGYISIGRGGEFRGRMLGGYAATAVDFMYDQLRKLSRGMRRVASGNQLNAGFASLSDLISEAASGKAQDLLYSKSATTATTVGNAYVARGVGPLPVASAVGGASGTGQVCTSATQGALKQADAAGGDTLHLTTWTGQASAISSLLLFDCLWDMTHNHASSLSTAVNDSNRPTRYQTPATAPGNFLSTMVTSTLSATAHNITVTYVDQDGNVAEAAPLYAAAVSAVAGRTNFPAGQWFMPMNSPDTGVSYITNITQSSITSVTGTSQFFIGHPLALAPFPAANVPFIYDGINSAFNLTRIYDGACLSFMTPAIATTGNITYTGLIRLVSG